MKTEQISPGARFRAAVAQGRPLPVVGAINAYCAMLAERAGHQALYLSGAGVANASLGLPDLGVTQLEDVACDVRRICSASSLPLLVDVDTGWGSSLAIARTTREMIRSGAAAMHLEDQVADKRCGHRPGKQLVATTEMEDRIKAAVDARTDPQFVVMARTDAVASEGLDGGLERANRYVEAGADMIFAEALLDLDSYRMFTSQLGAPVLANITEFGKTPLFTLDELHKAGVQLALFPLSAFRAMSQAALAVYREILDFGTQQGVIESMQTRDELYDVLNYLELERLLNPPMESTKDEPS